MYQPPEIRRLQFATYDLATQFQIHVCAMTYVRPHLLEFSSLIATKGKDAREFLQTELSRGSDDDTIVAVIQVFHDMQMLGTYDVYG